MNVRLNRRRTCVVVTASLITAMAIGGEPVAAEPLPLPVGRFQDGIYLPINDVDLTGPGGASVLANGNLSLTWAGSQLDVTAVDDELESLQSDLGLRGAITLDLSARTAGDIDDTLEILTLPLAQFTAGPATVTPYLGINVHISGEAEAGAQISIVAPFDVSAALSRNGRQTSATATEEPSFRPEIGLPDAANLFAFQVKVELEVTLTFMLAINGIPVGGPVLLAGLGTELVMDPTSWDLDGITSLRYGWSLPDATGAPEPPRRPKRLFPKHRWNIAHSDGGVVPADVSTRWSRAFGVDRNDSVGGAVAVGDELVVIEYGGTVGASNPWMSSIDGLGNPTWQQLDTERSIVEDLARTADGGFVSVSNGPRIQRFAADGTPLWARDLHVDGGPGKWYSVVATDGGVIIAGYVRHPGGDEQAMLVHVDDAGNVRWVTEVEMDDLHRSVQVNAVGEAPNGDLIVVGRVWYYPDSAHDDWDGLVMRIDRNDGSIKHAFTLQGLFAQNATDVAVHPDGSYALVGSTYEVSGLGSSALVATFDPQDQLLWSAAYQDQPGTSAVATGVTIVDGGDYVVSGTGVPAWDSWLMRIDGSGMPVWSKSFIGAGTDALAGVVSMSTGIAAFGSTTTPGPVTGGHEDIWVLRTSVDGMIHFDEGSGFDTVNGAVQWSTVDHQQHTIQPTVITPTVTVTDSEVGAEPAAAIDTALA